MSKAFTKEDDAGLAPAAPRRASLPRGERFMTPDGHARLRDELEALQRARAAAGPSHDDRALADMDKRIAHLGQCLAMAVVVPPPDPPGDIVYFGAVVTVADEDGQRTRYRIVGPDESDAARRWVSHASPLGAGLLGKQVGEWVTVQLPRGEVDLEVVSIQDSA